MEQQNSLSNSFAEGVPPQGGFGRAGVAQLVLSAWVVLFTCAAYRHAVFRSTAFDFGIFDQALWQLSQSKKPFNSLMRMNIFSDHAAFVLYPLSFFYRLYASPYVLLAVQSLFLSLGILPLIGLARYYRVNPKLQSIGALTYILHPVLFNTNLFDFHPETIAMPFLPLIVLWCEQRRYFWAAVAAIIVLSCKEVLALTLAALGVCLWIKKHKLFGAMLSGMALGWFVLVTTYVMPNLPYGAEANAFLRYTFLGESFGEKIQTVLFRPLFVLQNMHPLQSASYLFLLILPCLWCFGRQSLVYSIALVPLVTLNALSTLDLQRSLRLQHSLPLIPILSLMVIEKLRLVSASLQSVSAKKCIGWALLCSVVPLIAGNVRIYGEYPVGWAPIGEVSEFEDAIELIPAHVSVLASSRLVPHLSHRQLIRHIDTNEHRDVESATKVLDQYEYVVVDRTKGLDVKDRQANANVLEAVTASALYRIIFERGSVVVLARINESKM